MSQPLKSCAKSAKVAWCSSEAAPSLIALGSSANNAANAIAGGPGSQPTLDLVNFDPAKPAADMDVYASVHASNRFSSIAWGNLGVEGASPYGIIMGGLQDGVISLWNPHAIASSKGASSGLIHTSQVHQGSVNCLEFNPIKPTIAASCGSDGEVKILNLADPSKPEVFSPSAGPSKHAGQEVLCCAWNRKVQHILCSCSNTGSTVVWDLKMKKEVINFKDPSSRARCSAVAWNPEIPTQLIVAYDDDRHPSMQMWDLRNCQYPFKEAAGHTKGILDVAWNASDPNLLLSCGRDNKIICWNLSGGSLETFCEIQTQQGNFEARWAPHKPSIVAASSTSGAVNIYSVQTQQTIGAKYCPKWYGKPGGVSFGFGAKMLSWGAKTQAAVEGQPAAAPTASWCHSLVVPNEPEIVPTADMFERWIADRKLREFCLDRTQRCGGAAEHEGLMWELMGTQFEGEPGRQRVPSLLGFDGDHIVQEAEKFLGKKPGSTLTGPTPEEAQAAAAQPALQVAAALPPAPAFDLAMAEDFFSDLAQTTEQRKQEELEAEQKKQLAEAMGKSEELALGASKNDWSAGPEALIKKSLLIGNLPAAVECCFKCGRMAEGLLLASGGGTALWTRARDEYLRLQEDPFLSAVGSIMTNDFEKLVATSNLAQWKETLAILATYSGEHYAPLCLQLAARLEKFDIRSAVICYICAGDFSKTVTIWSNTHVASQGSKNLALQDLVEKMAVFQEATKFNQPDALFNQKLTQYAEILANSGRLTAAMRYLCLLRDDASSSILRERIYNSQPAQMSSMFGRPPAFPFETLDVRVAYAAPQHAAPAAATGVHHMAHHAVASRPGMPAPSAAPMGPRPGGMGPTPGGMGPALGGFNAPQPGLGARPCGTAAPGGMSAAPANQGLGPRPGMPAAPGGGYGHHGGYQQPTPQAPVLQQAAYHPTSAPTAGAGVLPPGGGMSPGQHSHGHSPHSAGQPGRQSTAPNASAMPVIEGLPVAWPLPTKTQQTLSTTSSVREANEACQAASAGGSMAIGDPMVAHELQHVRGVLGMLLEASAQDGNLRKRDTISQALDDLFHRLQTGQMKTTASQRVLQLVKAIEAQDYAGANQIQAELCKLDWESNKKWLPGLKRLIPQR